MEVMEKMNENLCEKCLFCFKTLDTESLNFQEQFLGTQNVYDSCCRFIRKEDLGDDFFKWNNSTTVPFCQRCFPWARKLSKMNAKLEAIQAQIDKFVKRFIEEFLREREANLSGYYSIKCEAESPLSDYDHQEQEDPFVPSTKSISENTDTDGEDTLLYEESDLEGEEVVIKKEVSDTDFADEYEKNDSFHFNESFCDDNITVNKKPVNRRTYIKRATKTILHRRNASIKANSAVKNKSKSKFEYSKRSQITPGRHALPRRRAALKAAKLFSSFNDDEEDEEMEDDVQSNISNGSHYCSDDYSESEKSSRKRRRPLKRGSKKKIACSKISTSTSVSVKCKYCKIVFKTESELESHISIHNEERPFACPKCGFRFTTQSFLIRHLKKHFDEKFFKCAHCENKYKYMHCLKDHVRIQKHHENTEDTDAECKLCEKAIALGKEKQLERKLDDELLPLTVTSIKSTVKRKTENSNDSQADMCELELTKEESELSVEKGQTGRKKTKVKRGEQVDRKTRLKKLYKCSDCDKNCYSKKKLLYHRHSHQPPGTEINCDECNEVFTDVLTLQNHTLSNHTKMPKVPGESKIQCSVCGKIFSSKGNLNKHMYLHSEVKQFPCPICMKRFSTRSALTAHSVYHKKDRPYLCEECGQGFHTGTKLREHYRVHTGMLLYCEHCPKGFRNSTHLKQHLRVHNKGLQQTPDAKDLEEETINPLLRFDTPCFENHVDINNHTPENTLQLQNVGTTIS